MKPKLFGLALTVFISIVFSTSALSQAVVQSFKAQGTIAPGWIVALSKTAKDAVELAPSDDPGRAYGVVVDPSAAPLTVQRPDSRVFVATSGDYPVLASTENGEIKTGDYLALSSISGIAAKAASDTPFVIGRALENFNGSTNTILRKNNSLIGYMRVQVTPGRNPLVKEVVAIPEPLRQLGESLAGRYVSPLRLYAALAVFLIAGIIAAVMLWSGIRNGLVAIGRNPLSRHLILRGLLQVIVGAALVLTCGVLGVYLLLKI